MIDLEELGIATAALMDTLEEADLPKESRVEELLVIAAVTWPCDEDGTTGNAVYYRCSSPLPWIQRGLLKQADRAIEASSVPYEDEEEEE